MWNAALKLTALVKVHAQLRAHVFVVRDLLEMIVGRVMDFIEGGAVRFCALVRNTGTVTAREHVCVLKDGQDRNAKSVHLDFRGSIARLCAITGNNAMCRAVVPTMEAVSVKTSLGDKIASTVRRGCTAASAMCFASPTRHARTGGNAREMDHVGAFKVHSG